MPVRIFYQPHPNSFNAIREADMGWRHSVNHVFASIIGIDITVTPNTVKEYLLTIEPTVIVARRVLRR